MRLLFTLLIVLFSITSHAQLVSYQLLNSYSTTQLDSLLSAANIPSGVFVPAYAVDFYKVLYMTPYKHPDSLVQVSGALVVPQNIDCPVALGGYFHGTVAKRTSVPSYHSQESLVGIIMASAGTMVSMPDYLGLGDSDTSVIIHPYIHAFSQANTSVNMLRAARQVADSLGVDLNGQVFLSGYSQGGFTTVATHKLIEEQYSNEFSITASAPMSGPYDLKVAQVELIASDSVYPTPGYLPFILLAYHSMYDQFQSLYPDISKVFKQPYDSLLLPLFYSKQYDIGHINNLSTPVPKHMMIDSLVDEFYNDSLHPFRLALAENHLLDWAPQAPIHLIYCNGDDQVTYKNSERAYDSWTALGAPYVQKTDLGNFSHGGCVQFAILAVKNYFDSFLQLCTSVNEIPDEEKIKIYPNPAAGYVVTEFAETAAIDIFDMTGRRVKNIPHTQPVTVIDIGNLAPGVYLVAIKSEGEIHHAKLLVR